MKSTWTYQRLLRLGVPAALIPGVLLALALGWSGGPLSTATSYNQITEIFPYRGTVTEVSDGDTFKLDTGIQIRLLAINAPDRGQDTYQSSKEHLEQLVQQKVVYLEYDRYQDDKYGRILAWVWVDCELPPKLLPFDYMKLTGNTSKEGLPKNPEGCKKGELVNQAMLEDGQAQLVLYKDRGELKYQKRLERITQTNKKVVE